MSNARQLLKYALSLTLPRNRFLVSGPSKHDRRGPTAPIEIALTFDDGPHPDWTPAVLDQLSVAGWKGTFFVIGERAEKYPELLRRIVDEGHGIGNHTYTHSPPNVTSAATFLNEVRRTHDVIRDLTGVSTTLMRPPLGKLNWGKFRGLWKARQSIVLWNTDPKDFSMTDERQADAWAQSYRPRTGDVILLHDRLPFAARIVRSLFQHRRESIRSVAISEWLETSLADGRTVRCSPMMAQPPLATGVSFK